MAPGFRFHRPGECPVPGAETRDQKVARITRMLLAQEEEPVVSGGTDLLTLYPPGCTCRVLLSFECPVHGDSEHADP